MTCLIIFLLKLIENALSTLRLILVANGKKIIGSVLMFIISIVWALSATYVVIKANVLNMISFALGAAIGSYIGSILEEKLALGNIIISFATNFNEYDLFKKLFTKYETFIIKNDNQYNFKIITKRKYKHKIINTIKNVDKSINIVIEKVNVI